MKWLACYSTIISHLNAMQTSGCSNLRRVLYGRLACLIVLLCDAVLLYAQPVKLWDKTYGGNDYEYCFAIQQTADGGFLVGGRTQSATGADLTEGTRGTQDMWIVKLAANGSKQWDKIIGTGNEGLRCISKTSDGGFILGGFSSAAAGGDKTENGKGGIDYWIVKIAANGTKEWDKTVGGTGTDELVYVEQTADGGYIIGGNSSSDAGADKTDPNYGVLDAWIVKLAANGTKEWDRTFGGDSYEFVRRVLQTPDGGYIVGAHTSSGISGNKTTALKGGISDFWLIKLNANGTTAWEKGYGGNDSDDFSSLALTSDGGFIAAGNSFSGISGDKSEAVKGASQDYWVIKLDGDGVKQWDRTIGSNDSDELSTVIQLSDGSYILGGSSLGAGIDKTESGKGWRDYWIVKLASNGTKVWDKSFGGDLNDGLTIMLNTSDNGFALAGNSPSAISGDKTQAPRGQLDFWIVRTTDETALPVTLKSFTAGKAEQSVHLTWVTGSETNSDRFEVEHSIEPGKWQTIAIIAALGESATSREYRFEHHEPVYGAANLYRLKMIDADRSFAYSAVKSVTFESDLVLYPNPASDKLLLRLTDWAEVEKVTLRDSWLHTVYASGAKPAKEIDVRNLNAGIYILEIARKGGSGTVRKIMIGK